MRRGFLWTAAIGVCLVGCAQFSLQTKTPAERFPPERTTLESGLVRIVTFEGEEGLRASLEERRAELGVPAVSVAVLRDGEIHWAGAYGSDVDESTLFQAASLSKTVAAAGLITLANERGVSLDDDLSGDLPADLIATINPGGIPLTLRKLLSHTNGAAVSGFPGYPAGSAVPTTQEVVLGAGPTNTDPVLISPNPDGERRYSGGGYTIAQLWAETVTGETFPALMQRLVLEPVGMPRSTFSQAVPGGYPDDNMARAYDREGSPVESGWHIYPEMAAAGLWTTPTEFLTFIGALMAALDGDESRGIDPAVAQVMVIPVASDYGLGIGAAPKGDTIRLSHSGSNRGFRCNFMAYPDRNDAVITMTNASVGWAMVGDVGRTANTTYGWPMVEMPIYTRAEVTEGELDAFTGQYRGEGSDQVLFTLSVEGDTLKAAVFNGSEFTLVKIGEATFIDPNDGEEAVFAADEDGRMVATSGGARYVRL